MRFGKCDAKRDAVDKAGRSVIEPLEERRFCSGALDLHSSLGSFLTQSQQASALITTKKHRYGHTPVRQPYQLPLWQGPWTGTVDTFTGQEIFQLDIISIGNGRMVGDVFSPTIGVINFAGAATINNGDVANGRDASFRVSQSTRTVFISLTGIYMAKTGWIHGTVSARIVDASNPQPVARLVGGPYLVQPGFFFGP